MDVVAGTHPDQVREPAKASRGRNHAANPAATIALALPRFDDAADGGNG